MFKKIEKNRITHSSKDLFLNLIAIIKNKQSWIITIIGSSLYITISAFAILWSVPFLTKVYNNEKIAAFGSSTIFLGSLIGGIFTGFFVNRIGSRKSFIKYLSIITFFLMLFLIFFGKYFPKTNFIILFLIGAFTTVQLFSYTLIVDANDMKKKGTSIAFTNFFVWLAGAISQPLVGKILDLVSRHNIYVDEKSFYTLENFQIAMLIFPLSYLIAFIFSFFIKEKNFDKKKLA